MASSQMGVTRDQSHDDPPGTPKGGVAVIAPIPLLNPPNPANRQIPVSDDFDTTNADTGVE